MSKNVLNTKWRILNDKTQSSSDNLAVQILLNRGYKKKEIDRFLQPNYAQHLGDPLQLPGVKPACKRIQLALDNNEKIVIYGDYDIDGITASVLLYTFLQSAKADVSMYVPDRFEEGYGLNSEAIKQLKKDGADLIITVDCGVTSNIEIDLAKKLQLDIIITDHHEPPKNVSKNAIAIINPKLSSNKYPFSDLAGVGVVFGLVRAMQKMYPGILEIGQEKWFLDLVALGTVCDVVTLKDENRVLAYYGLKVLKQTPRVGLRALAEVAGVNISEITEFDLGFRLGPRLNAAGRLEHAKIALDLLVSESYEQAITLASKLNDLNADRQAQTQQVFIEADAAAKKQVQNLVLVLAGESWSSGIVGIVASRIAEKWHKPTIILQSSEESSKGSARSYADFSLIDALHASNQHLTKYGGHHFAAGLTLNTKDIPKFTNTINKYALKTINIEDLVPQYTIDITLSEKYYLNKTDVATIRTLAPFGNQNPEPLFSSIFVLKQFRYIGQDKSHIKFQLNLPNSNTTYDGISFRSAHKWHDLVENEKYHFAFYLQENTWQNTTTLQLQIIDIKRVK